MNTWMYPAYYAEDNDGEFLLRRIPHSDDENDYGDIDCFFMALGILSVLYTLSFCFYMIYIISTMTYSMEYYTSYNRTLDCFKECLPQK